MTVIKTIFISLVLVVLLGVGFIYSGLYPIGADNRHHALTFWALETLREKSIARAAKAIEVPALDNPDLLLSGGADYNDMCAGCHLSPGKTENDMTIGLYPKPPNLAAATLQETQDGSISQAHLRQQFWVIKHGIMASGMAAFGPTHSDERIWAMVAFIQKLPQLNALQYQILTTRQDQESTHH